MTDSAQNEKKQVALFITCLTDQFYPQVGIAVTKILEHFGCTVHFPHAQTCCGQPFFNNGFSPKSAELAKRTSKSSSPTPYIVTPSGSCCAMVRDQYPTLLAGDPAWEPGMHRVCPRPTSSSNSSTKSSTSISQNSPSPIPTPSPTTTPATSAASASKTRPTASSARSERRFQTPRKN